MLKQLSVIAIALLATQANAAVNQPFVTLGFGQSSYSEVSDFCANELLVSVNCDDKDTAFRIGAGVAISPMYAVELTYMNHGEVGGAYAEPGFDAKIDLEAETFALQASVQTSIAPQINVYGKAGLALTKASVSYQENDVFFGSFSETDDNDTTGLILSIGAQYEVMPNLMADIQFDFLPDAIEYKDANFESDITTISAGLKYQF